VTPIQVSRQGVIRDPDSGYVTTTDGNPLSEPKANIWEAPDLEKVKGQRSDYSDL